MNKKQYQLLCSNFNKQKDIDQYEMWKEIFSDKDIYYDVIMDRTIKYIIENDKYMPSVARIKEVYVEMFKAPLTPAEKLKRWKEKGIIPSCLSKVSSETKINNDEFEKLQEFFEGFQC